MGADGDGLEPAQQARHPLHPLPGPADAACGWRTSPTSSCTPRSRSPTTSSARRHSPSTSIPGAPASIVECCEVALELRGMFDQLGLSSFAKTSGSKGLQVYVPAERSARDLRADEAVRARRRRHVRAAPSRPRRLGDGEGRAHRQGADRLEPERRAQDDGQRLLAAREGTPNGLDARRLGRGRSVPRLKAIRLRWSSTPRRSGPASPSAATCSPRSAPAIRSCRRSEG